LLVCTCTW